MTTINVKCKYCGKWKTINLSKCKVWRLQCCSKECTDAYFLATGCGFNLSFSQADILHINNRISLKPAKLIVDEFKGVC